MNNHYDTTDVCRVVQVGVTRSEVVSLNGSTLTFGDDLYQRSLDLGSNGVRSGLAGLTNGQEVSGLDFTDDSFGTFTGSGSMATEARGGMAEINAFLDRPREALRDAGLDDGVDGVVGSMTLVRYIGERTKPAGFIVGTNWDGVAISAAKVCNYSREIAGFCLPLMYAIGAAYSGYLTVKWLSSHKPGDAASTGTSVMGTHFPGIQTATYSLTQLVICVTLVSGTITALNAFMDGYVGGDLWGGGLSGIMNAMPDSGAVLTGSAWGMGDGVFATAGRVAMAAFDSVVPVYSAVFWATAFASTAAAQYIFGWVAMRINAVSSTVVS